LTFDKRHVVHCVVSASLRVEGPFDLTARRGLEVRFMGDGQIYKLQAQTPPTFRVTDSRIRFAGDFGGNVAAHEALKSISWMQVDF